MHDLLSPLMTVDLCCASGGQLDNVIHRSIKQTERLSTNG